MGINGLMSEFIINKSDLRSDNVQRMINHLKD